VAQSFHDTAGRTWSVNLNVYVVGQLRKQLDVDIYKISDEKMALLQRILGDPCLLVDILFCICEDQAEKQQVTAEQFGRSFAGDVLEQAATAFVEAVVDFFPDPKVRERLRAVMQTGKRVQQRMIELVTADVDQKLSAIDVETEAQRVWKDIFGKSPEP
jgi:hypothetical protein